MTDNSISVIMAARNSSRTIRSAIRSCLLALGRHDELLLFLDGCEDDTEVLAQSINDSRLIIYKSEHSVGRSAARNFLIEKAKGQILAVQDSDDLSLPWRFSCARRLLKKFDVVFGNGVIFGSRPKYFPFAPLYPFAIYPDLAPLVLTYRNPFIHSGAVFRKSVLSGNLRYNSVVAEEYLLWLQLALRNLSMYRTRFPHVAYRIHSNQVTNSKTFATEVEQCAEIRSAQLALTEAIRKSPRWSTNSNFPQSRNSNLRGVVHKLSFWLRFEETFLNRFSSALLRGKRKLRTLIRPSD